MKNSLITTKVDPEFLKKPNVDGNSTLRSPSKKRKIPHVRDTIFGVGGFILNEFEDKNNTNMHSGSDVEGKGRFMSCLSFCSFFFWSVYEKILSLFSKAKQN